MLYRMIIHLNIELQIPVIYRADLRSSWLYPFDFGFFHAFLLVKFYIEIVF